MDVSWLVYPLVALGIIVMIVLSKITKVMPAPLVSVVVVTGRAGVRDHRADRRRSGQTAAQPSVAVIPNVLLTWKTFTIIAPFALGVALVGLMESPITARLVDEITTPTREKGREVWAQGVSNVLSGMFGGMGGYAVIGQTMINPKASGERARISTFCTEIFLFLLVVVSGDFVGTIPMSALGAVMVAVAIGAFGWHSVRPSTLKRMPKSETFVTGLWAGCSWPRSCSCGGRQRSTHRTHATQTD